jgi:hypothetical protein
MERMNVYVKYKSMFIYMTKQNKSLKKKKKDMDGQCDTDTPSWLSVRSQLNLHTAEQGLRNTHKILHLFCDWGKTYKAVFFIYGDTRICPLCR